MQRPSSDHSPALDDIPQDRVAKLRQSLLIAVVLLSIHTLTYSGIAHVDDEQLVAASAQSLVLWNDLSLPQLSGNERIGNQAFIRSNQTNFNLAIEPGESLLASLFYRIGHQLGVGGAQASMLTNLYLTTLTGVVVYLILRAMGFRESTGTLGALAFGLGTMAWPYSKTLFRDVLLMFCASLVFLGFTLTEYQSKNQRGAGLGLIALGMLGGILTKRTAWIFLPALAITILLFLFEKSKSKVRTIHVFATLTVISVVLITAIVFIPPQGPLARFSLVHIAYALERMVDGVGENTLLGLLGPFVSPGKSIFLYSPILILAPLGLALGWSTHKRMFVFALSATFLLALVQALFYQENWAGISVWGLRFMLLTLPAGILLCSPVFDEILTSGNSLPRWVFATLAGISVLVQIAGAAISWTRPLILWSRAGYDPLMTSWPWNLASSPIPIHLSLLLEPTWRDIAWMRVVGSTPQAALIPLHASICAILGISLLAREKREPPAHRHLWLPIALAITSFMLPIFPSLHLLRQDPAVVGNHVDFDAAVAQVESQAQRDDLILVDSYGTPLWHYLLNHWRSDVPWYSLPYNYQKEMPMEGSRQMLTAAEWIDRWSTTRAGSWSLWVITLDASSKAKAFSEMQFDSFTLVPVRTTAFDGVEVMQLLIKAD